MTGVALTALMSIMKQNDRTQKNFVVQSFGKVCEKWNLIYRYHWKNTDMKIFG